MKIFRIYETGNNTGKKWFYAKQKYLFWYSNSEFEELSQRGHYGEGSENPNCRRFNSKDELIATIKAAIKKDFERTQCRESIYHKVVDEITVPD